MVCAVPSLAAHMVPVLRLLAPQGLFDALQREAQEEAGVTLDPAYGMRLLGGHHTGGRRDGRINSMYMQVAARAASLDAAPDGVEVEAVHWFEIRGLLDTWRDGGSAKKFDLAEGMRVPGHEDKLCVKGNNMRCVEGLYEDRNLVGTVKQDRDGDASTTFSFGSE